MTTPPPHAPDAIGAISEHAAACDDLDARLERVAERLAACAAACAAEVARVAEAAQRAAEEMDTLALAPSDSRARALRREAIARAMALADRADRVAGALALHTPSPA